MLKVLKCFAMFLQMFYFTRTHFARNHGYKY